jgi:hypothetical protein
MPRACTRLTGITGDRRPGQHALIRDLTRAEVRLVRYMLLNAANDTKANLSISIGYRFASECSRISGD